MSITAVDLKRARNALHENHSQFAKRFGVDRSTYTGWEGGKLPREGTAPLLIERVMAELESYVQEPVK
jgi:DNA-binding transcriptional regulator YiaG